MRFRARRSIRLGPLPVYVNVTERGVSSWSIRLGPWSWNSRTRRQTLDTPGPGAVSWGGRNRGPRAQG